MIGKHLKKIIQQLLSIFYINKEKEICPAYISKNNSICKNNSLNDPKRRKRRLELYCSEKKYPR